MTAKNPTLDETDETDGTHGTDDSGETAETTEPLRLRRLLDTARTVLLDFDGPVCDLFGGRSTRPAALEIKAMARRKWNTLDPAVEACDDSHGILHPLRDMLDRKRDAGLDPAVLREANDIVTRYEYECAGSAEPAPGIQSLLDSLLGRGKRLAIVTNNAEGPVRRFLELHGMSRKFEAVCGRDPGEPRRMKPDPASVHRALRALSPTSPAHAVMIGDQLTDLRAAVSAGVGFLGYSTEPERARLLRCAGAHGVVASHARLVTACAPPQVSRSRP
ncbi:HAD family hydrolase [Streptomyces phaeolivaceus]|uniref:HAD family hydrolase n=1 Tax=Streptomyces phaeolivaceus TaxID=2653200 RepID=A0A5P8K5U0_9ACTN|nr:HAD family hydrolase [Streptomyces phaeolivaceus]QFQ98390.1 HAD family hydrolase [Streptomyces phaeolivaceus]